MREAKMSQPADDRSATRIPVTRDPKIHSGDLVFAGTRVPVENFVDYLKGGDTVDQFLADFPTVQRWQVEELLDLNPELGGSATRS
jgi:uncharacterized protein (DUF433 family)